MYFENIFIGFMVFVFAIFIGMIVASPFISNVGRSEGVEYGYVTAVQKQGIIWQTSRVYLKTELESSNEDVYCVQDDAVVEVLREKLETKERVALHYDHPLIEWNWNCGRENDIVRRVE